MRSPRPVFVVGCPRSGSTWLSFLLAEHPAVVSFHHAKLFDYLDWMRRWYANKSKVSYLAGAAAGSGGDPGERDSGPYLAEVLPEEAHHALLGEYVRGILGRVAAIAPGSELVVDKTPENLRHAELISAVLPQARFVHIVRDPRAVFCSQRSASRSWSPWEFPTRALDGARFWKEQVETGRAIGRTTESYHEVRYEDLVESGPATVERLLAELGLTVESGFGERAVAACEKSRMRRRKEFPPGFVRRVPRGGWREELSRGEVRLIEHVAGELMTELGYECVAPPFRGRPWRIRLHDGGEALLGWVERRARRLTQLLHWGWVGRKLEWPEP